jgi:hypothetical protein
MARILVVGGSFGKRGIRFVHGAARSIDTAAQTVVSTAGVLPRLRSRSSPDTAKALLSC